MVLKIKNYMLKNIYDFMFKLNLKGQESRHRTRFLKEVNKVIEQLSKDEKLLLDEYGTKNEKGEVVPDENNNYHIEDMEAFLIERKKLSEEEFVYGGSNNQKTIETLKEIIFKFEEEVSGATATCYNFLYEEFEKMGYRENE